MLILRVWPFLTSLCFLRAIKKLLVFLLINTPSSSSGSNSDVLSTNFSWYRRMKSKIEDYSKVEQQHRSNFKVSVCPLQCVCLEKGHRNVRCIFLQLKKIPPVGNGTTTLWVYAQLLIYKLLKDGIIHHLTLKSLDNWVTCGIGGRIAVDFTPKKS